MSVFLLVATLYAGITAKITLPVWLWLVFLADISYDTAVGIRRLHRKDS